LTQYGINEKQVDDAVAEVIATPGSGYAVDKVQPYLSFTWAVVAPSDDYGADVYKLEAICRQRQWQRLTVDVPPTGGIGVPCQFDRRRPAVGMIEFRDDKFRASASVQKRHEYGRKERQYFIAMSWDGGTANPSFRSLRVCRISQAAHNRGLAGVGHGCASRHLPVARASLDPRAGKGRPPAGSGRHVADQPAAGEKIYFRP
jgi:hypothetical protein